jgi:hypothetical protein
MQVILLAVLSETQIHQPTQAENGCQEICEAAQRVAQAFTIGPLRDYAQNRRGKQGEQE